MNTKLLAMLLTLSLSTVACVAPAEEDDFSGGSAAAITGTVGQSTVRQIRAAYTEAKEEDFTLVDLESAPPKAESFISKLLKDSGDARQISAVSTFQAGRLGMYHVVEIATVVEWKQDDTSEDGGHVGEGYNEFFFFDKGGTLRAYARDEDGKMAWFAMLSGSGGNVTAGQPVP